MRTEDKRPTFALNLRTAATEAVARQPSAPLLSVAGIFRAVSLAVLLDLVLALALERAGLVWLAATVSAVVGVFMLVADATAPLDRWRCIERAWVPAKDRWRSQAFSFLLGAVCLSLAALMHGSVFATALTVSMLALGALSAFTPFCLGRLIFVVFVGLWGARR